jgi:hypothetical protein
VEGRGKEVEEERRGEEEGRKGRDVEEERSEEGREVEEGRRGGREIKV